MPIREDAQTLQSRIYRTFRFGNMATLFMLDTRLVGRDQEAPREDTTTIELPNRQLLGAEQEGWLAEQLVTSVRNQARWNLFGQQVMFAPQTETGVRAAIPIRGTAIARRAAACSTWSSARRWTTSAC